MLATSPGRQLALFDAHPIQLAGFQLRARAAVPVGTPTADQLSAALEFASAAAESSPYWVGDLLNYADTRADLADRIEQIKSITGLAHHTLINLSYVSRKVDEETRQAAPTIAHSAEVAPLPKQEQVEWLEKASTEGWTQRELRNEIRASQRRRVVEGQAVLAGRFRVIYADPPWSYSDSAAPPIAGSLGKAARHYPTMSMEDIASLPVQAHTMENAVLFLWVPAPMLMLNPGPRDVIEAWGFEYKTGMVWDKVLGNYGHYVHVTHEHLLICTRGSCLPDCPTPSPKSVLVERRSNEHSKKPESVRRLIRQLYSEGPYLELFGREPSEGWTVFGNDARLWHLDDEEALDRIPF